MSSPKLARYASTMAGMTETPDGAWVRVSDVVVELAARAAKIDALQCAERHRGDRLLEIWVWDTTQLDWALRSAAALGTPVIVRLGPGLYEPPSVPIPGNVTLVGAPDA